MRKVKHPSEVESTAFGGRVRELDSGRVPSLKEEHRTGVHDYVTVQSGSLGWNEQYARLFLMSDTDATVSRSLRRGAHVWWETFAEIRIRWEGMEEGRSQLNQSHCTTKLL